MEAFTAMTDSEGLPKTIRDHIVYRLATIVQRGHSRLTSDSVARFSQSEIDALTTEFERQSYSYADRIVQQLSPQLQPIDHFISQATAKFEEYVENSITSHVRSDKPRNELMPYTPRTRKEDDPIGWMREIAEDAAAKLREAKQQGVLTENDVIQLLGKIEAYRNSTLQSLQIPLEDARRTRLVNTLLDKYQDSIHRMLQEVFARIGRQERPMPDYEPVMRRPAGKRERKKILGLF